MSTYPIPYEISSGTALALDGDVHDQSGIEYITAGVSEDSSPSLEVRFRRWERLIKNLLDTHLGKVIRSTGGERHIGCAPFMVPYADGSSVQYAGNTGYELSGGDDTYYVYIDRSGATPVLAHGTAWPASRDDYIPLAIYTVTSGAIVTDDDEADRRSLAVYGGFLDTTAVTGTTGTAFTLDSDNAGAGASSAVCFNRGSTAADAQLEWNETSDRFELESELAGPTLASINLLSVLVSGTTALDSNGAAKVAAAVAGDGLAHSSGVLSVNVDDATVEIDTDIVRLKDGGITTAKLGDTLADKLVQISIGDATGASPQTVTIQAKDIQGNNLAEVVYVQVGVYNDAAGAVNSTNATIADGGDGSLVRWVTENKVGIFATDATGSLEIAVTDGTAETVYVCAAPTVRSRMMDCADYGTAAIS